MADYAPLIQRAIGALAENTPAARRAIYERAEAALLRQLQSIDPPLSAETIARERAALARAVADIEAGFLPTREQILQAGEPPQTAPPQPGPPEPAPRGEARPEPRPEPRRSPPPAAPVRPRAPERRPQKRISPLVGVAVALGVIAIAGVGTFAYLNRNRPPAVATQTPPPAPPAPTASKPDDRVTTDGGPGPAAPQAPPAQPSAPAAQPPEPAAPSPAGQAAAPPTAGPASPPPAGQPAIPVANRLVLVLEGTDGGALAARQGSIVWRTEQMPAGPAQPLETVVRAVMEVPEARLRAEMVLRANRDPAFPASHTIDLRFQQGAGSELTPIVNVNVIEARQVETQAGYAMVGQGIAVVENVFLIALSNSEIAAQRNIEMLRVRPWLYFEFRTLNGRRGALLFEKGVSGQQAIEEALRIWAR